jgi:hypothetical protein
MEVELIISSRGRWDYGFLRAFLYCAIHARECMLFPILCLMRATLPLLWLDLTDKVGYRKF